MLYVQTQYCNPTVLQLMLPFSKQSERIIALGMRQAQFKGYVGIYPHHLSLGIFQFLTLEEAQKEPLFQILSKKHDIQSLYQKLLASSGGDAERSSLHEQFRIIQSVYGLANREADERESREIQPVDLLTAILSDEIPVRYAHLLLKGAGIDRESLLLDIKDMLGIPCPEPV
jgi:hypothetical protein